MSEYLPEKHNSLKLESSSAALPSELGTIAPDNIILQQRVRKITGVVLLLGFGLLLFWFGFFLTAILNCHEAIAVAREAAIASSVPAVGVVGSIQNWLFGSEATRLAAEAAIKAGNAKIQLILSAGITLLGILSALPLLLHAHKVAHFLCMLKCPGFLKTKVLGRRYVQISLLLLLSALCILGGSRLIRQVSPTNCLRCNVPGRLCPACTGTIRALFCNFCQGSGIAPLRVGWEVCHLCRGNWKGLLENCSCQQGFVRCGRCHGTGVETP